MTCKELPQKEILAISELDSSYQELWTAVLGNRPLILSFAQARGGEPGIFLIFHLFSLCCSALDNSASAPPN